MEYVCWHAYIPHVSCDLANLDQKVKPGLPFRRAETRLARKVVDMVDEPLHDIVEAFIARPGADRDCIGGDVVDGQISHGGALDRFVGHVC